MKRSVPAIVFVSVLALGVCCWATVPHVLNYQGFLADSSGVPLDTTVDVVFRIYDGASGGAALLWNETHSGVTVSSGLFNVSLGATTPVPENIFADSSVYLGVQVGADTEMTPRSRLASVAYAHTVGTIDGASGGAITSDLDIAGTLTTNSVDASTLSASASASVHYFSVDSTADISENLFVGQELIIGNKARIGSGSSNNGVRAFAVGDSNTASGAYSAALGGRKNSALGDYSIAAGRRARANNSGSFVWSDATDAEFADSAANQLRIRATGGTYIYSNAGLTEGVYLAPGSSCWVSVDPTDSCGGSGGGGGITSINGLSGGTVTSSVVINGQLNVGGSANINSGTQSFVSGSNNKARGNYSTVSGGGGASAIDSNSAAGSHSTIGGGRRNVANGTEATVGGGVGCGANGTQAFVGGGSYNKASGNYSVVCGGGGNSQADSNRASGTHAFVGGGERNTATSLFTTVIGGRMNNASDTSSVICGGTDNSASGDTVFIGGGYSNSAAGDWSVIAGGYDNTTSSAGEAATISGGLQNTANGVYATVGGGSNNSANGQNATIAGGNNNSASGIYSCIPGGNNNLASGRYAFAAGKQASATGIGSFVWSDSTGGLSSFGANTFSARAVNGFRFYTSAALGAELPSGGSAWQAISDSTVKRNKRLVNSADILDKVTQLPIKRWSYVTQDSSVEHIGPMAQDFWNLFGVGDDSLKISTIDPAGIALAAIQALVEQNQKLQTSNDNLETRVRQLEDRLEQLAPVRMTSAK